MNKVVQAVKYFFSYDFQIYINRVRFETVDKVFVGLVLLLCAFALAALVARKLASNPITKGLVNRWFVWAGSMGMAGLIWVGARYQLVGLFGTHLAFIVLLIVAGVWKLFIVKYQLKMYSAEKMAWEKQQLKAKYLN